MDDGGVLYIADGVTVKAVDERGRIATVIGSQSSWRPLLCYHSLQPAVPASQVRASLLLQLPDKM